MAHYICTCGVDHPTEEGRIICEMEHGASRKDTSSDYIRAIARLNNPFLRWSLGFDDDNQR